MPDELFGKLPAAAFSDCRLTDGERCTLAYVRFRIHNDCEGFRLSEAEVAGDRGMSPRRVRGHLAKLVELGYLRRDLEGPVNRAVYRYRPGEPNPGGTLASGQASDQDLPGGPLRPVPGGTLASGHETQTGRGRPAGGTLASGPRGDAGVRHHRPLPTDEIEQTGIACAREATGSATEGRNPVPPLRDGTRPDEFPGHVPEEPREPPSPPPRRTYLSEIHLAEVERWCRAQRVDVPPRAELERLCSFPEPGASVERDELDPVTVPVLVAAWLARSGNVLRLGSSRRDRDAFAELAKLLESSRTGYHGYSWGFDVIGVWLANRKGRTAAYPSYALADIRANPTLMRSSRPSQGGFDTSKTDEFIESSEKLPAYTERIDSPESNRERSARMAGFLGAADMSEAQAAGYGHDAHAWKRAKADIARDDVRARLAKTGPALPHDAQARPAAGAAE